MNRTEALALPCGCVADVVDDIFVYQPCSPYCKYYRYVLTSARRQGKPLDYVIDPDIEEEP